MSTVLNAETSNIKFPRIFMNDEFDVFIKQNSLKSTTEGSKVTILDGMSNHVHYQKETYDSDVVYVKA